MAYVRDESGIYRWIPDENLDESFGPQDQGLTSPTQFVREEQKPDWLRTPAWLSAGTGRKFYKPSPLKEARTQGYTSVQEKELVEKAGETKKDFNLNWWREDGEYVGWLRSIGWDPDTTPDWLGSKKFLDYIKYKAEHPEGLAALSAQSAEAIGSVIKEISDVVKGVPVIGAVAKPVGSVFKFIGNLIDMPMNIVRGAYTALASGHGEETLNNVWEAMKHGATAGTEGEYFSFTDASLRVLIDKKRQSMTNDEYNKYINSDDYRKTKRAWQAGGLLLDLALDPMWLVGAGESKMMSSFRVIKNIKSDIGKLISSNYNMLDTSALTKLWKHFDKRGNAFVNYLSKDSRIAQDFGIGYEQIEKFKQTAKEVSKQEQLIDIIDTSIKTYQSNIGKFDAYGYRMKFYQPFTKREEVLFDIPINMEPLKRKLSRLFGGEQREAMKQANRMMSYYADNWRVMDKGYHTQMGLYKGQVEQLLVGLKKVNPSTTINDATEYWWQMMAAHHVDKEGRIFSKAIGDTPGFKIVGDIKVTPPKELESPSVFNRRDLPKMVGTELSDEFGNIILISDKTGYTKQLIKPFAKLEGELYSVTKADMADMVREWSKTSDNLLKVETQLKRQLATFMESEGMGKFGKYWLDTISNSRRSHRIWGIKNVYDIKSGKLQHEFITYMPQEITEEASRFLKAIERAEGDPIRSHLDQMLYQQQRLTFLPTDITNEFFLKKIFNKKRAANWISEIQKGKLNSATHDKLWHESMARLRQIIKKKNEKEYFNLFRDLQNTNLGGNKYDFEDFGQVVYKNEDFAMQPLIQRFDAVTINRMSRKGKIFKNFNKDIFKIDPEVMINRIENTHKLVGRIEASIHGLKRGIDDGWLVRKHQFLKDKKGKDAQLVEFPKPVDKYLGNSDWVSGDGIFAGFWVPEMFRDSMEAFSRGILKWTEPPDIFKIDKVLQMKPFQILKKFNQWWKVQVYMKHPATHARNFTTNRLMMWGEGRSPHHAFFPDAITKDALMVHNYSNFVEQRYGRLKKGLDVKSLDKKIAFLEGKEINLGDFGNVPIRVAWEEMQKNGVSGNAFFRDILGRQQRKAGLSVQAKDEALVKKILKSPQLEMPKWFTDWNVILGSKDKWTQAGTKAASFIEEGLGRNELFLHLLRNKGMTIEDAARRVNKIMVDYGSLSRGEKVLKDYFLPFYSWQSRMIGVIFEKAIQQPIFFNKLTQIQNQMYKMLEQDKAFSPMYEKTGEGIPIIMPGQWGKFFIEGKPMSEIDTKYVTAERFLPQAVVNLVDTDGFKDIINPFNFAKKAVEGFFEYTMGNLTPFIKTPMEQIIDYSFYFKRPISRYADQTVKYAGIKMSPKVNNVIRSFIGGMKEIDEIVGWFDKNPYTGKPYHTVATTLFSWTMGMKAYDRNEIKEIQYTLGNLRDEYKYNARDARNKVHDPAQVKIHARKAVAIKYAINILEWYKNYAIEFQDKELYDRLKMEGRLK